MVSERVLITGAGITRPPKRASCSGAPPADLTRPIVPFSCFLSSATSRAPFFGPRTAMTPTEVTEKLGLLKMTDRSWYCHPSNALDGSGLAEGECPRRRR